MEKLPNVRMLGATEEVPNVLTRPNQIASATLVSDQNHRRDAG
jgi:hypothetical protein